MGLANFLPQAADMKEIVRIPYFRTGLIINSKNLILHIVDVL